MIHVRKSEERGRADHGWLDTRHTFSFADYYDPKFLGFRSLRVLNEDRVAPGEGFGMHGHRDMEILSYVVGGQLAHRDSMGHEETLGPNEIQRMSAGSGIMHSEFNPSKDSPVHFFQIWITPTARGGKPSYEQLRFDPADKKNRLKRLAGPDGGDAAARINQDAHVFVSELDQDATVRYGLAPERAAWVQVVRGTVELNGVALAAGDAAAVSTESELSLRGTAAEASEILLFDVV
jgi:redox-sensitive bicupin YhaK (pirin superfamily)